MNQEVFIYGLIDPITNQLRYVGKSINPKVRLRNHISERNLHDSYKDRWIKKLSESHKGIQGGINHPLYGKHHTEKTKDKLSEHFSKPVLQFDLDGNFIREWESIKQAQETLKIGNISNACRKNKNKTSGGFIWKYKE